MKSTINSIKDYLVVFFIVWIFLLAAFALDDSYEDSKLSAQVLDEAIAHARQQKHLALSDETQF